MADETVTGDETESLDAEYLLVVKQWEDLQVQFDLLDKEADEYARNMHDAHKAVALLWDRLSEAQVPVPEADEAVTALISAVLQRSLPQKGGDLPPTTIRPVKATKKPATAVTTQLGELGS